MAFKSRAHERVSKCLHAELSEGKTNPDALALEPLEGWYCTDSTGRTPLLYRYVDCISAGLLRICPPYLKKLFKINNLKASAVVKPPIYISIIIILGCFLSL